MEMSRRALIFLTTAIFLLAPGLQAAPGGSDSSSLTQVDGIVSAVVDNLWAQGDMYWHEGDYPRIIALDRIITQADPHFVDAFNTGAWLMWSDGLDGDAQAFYELAVRSNPHDPAAYYDYGMFLFNHRHDYAAAIRVYRRDVQQASPGVLDWRMLAHSYEKADAWDQAVGIWRQIKARWPHGDPRDPTHGDIDDQNLRRALSHLSPAASEQKAPTL
jgi:tetratricopeptide (TPR) repeat protein